MLKSPLATPPSEADEQVHHDSVVAVRSGGAAGNNLHNIGLIVEREYRNRVMQRSFVVSTIIILVLLLIGSCVPTIVQFIAARSSSQTKVAVVNNAGTIGGMDNPALVNYLTSNLNGQSSGTPAAQPSGSQPRFSVSQPTNVSLANLRQQVQDDKLSIVLAIDRTSTKDLHFTYYTKSNNITDTSTYTIQALSGQLSILDKSARLGLTPAQTSSLFAQPAFQVVSVGAAQDTRSVSNQVAGYIVAYVGIILIFMSVFLYGMGVAMGVAEEKGSRIMEILANAATPFQLMAGKIIGLGAAGLTQMVLLVGVGIIGLLLQTPLKSALLGSNDGGLNIDVTGVSITLLLLLLLYFILGFLLYASLFAAVGALVRRQDEVQNAVQPVTWLFMIGYIVSFIGISNPNATWVKVVSFIPFWTPTTMLMRVGAGAVDWWEIVLSIVLLLVAIVVCMYFSARIYRYGILMYGQKPGLGQFFRLARMK